MTLDQLNSLDVGTRREALGRCCGAGGWLDRMEELFPAESVEALYAAAEKAWSECSAEDGLEAFSHHPRIGEQQLRDKWASGEQSGVNQALESVLQGLAAGNAAYEKKFGYIFLVCATGKSAEEMLLLLRERLNHGPEEEIRIAMGEQGKITRLRLEKLLT